MVQYISLKFPELSRTGSAFCSRIRGVRSQTSRVRSSPPCSWSCSEKRYGSGAGSLAQRLIFPRLDVPRRPIVQQTKAENVRLGLAHRNRRALRIPRANVESDLHF